jgi:hypothetical protein
MVHGGRCSAVACYVYSKAQKEFTPLISAGECGHAACMRVLLEAGADNKAKTRVRCMLICLLLKCMHLYV